MKILGIESSTQTASVALSEDKRILGEISLYTGLTHSESLMGLIDGILLKTGTPLAAIQGIAVSVGPGSFTGVRIAMATAMGLSRAGNIPMTGISTLEGIAHVSADFRGIIVPIQDARRDQVYTAVFKGEGGRLTRLEEDQTLSVEELKTLVAGQASPVLLCGPDAHGFYERIKTEATQLVAFINQQPRGAALCEISLEREFSFEIRPNYVRRSQAERAYFKEFGVHVLND
ncbi:MAG: hypothetical protein AVO33_07810 [delta proteobacterium ML8_F1]|nr:MAG: hypothetical protein AVO33_07810 [delta proteobacterium ML8_F1]